jgi:putative FmdB family regulatory protein
MPIYEFQCESCGLRFDKLMKMASSDELTTTPCKDCGDEARRMVTAAAFKFSHPSSQLRGMAPPNTGTSDDWKFDKIIGRDSEKKWKTVEERNSEKNRVVRQERESGFQINNNQLVRSHDDGSYRKIAEPERQAINERRTAAAAVANANRKKD